MKVVLAPDKFKGSLSANEVCEALETGIKNYDQNIKVIHHPLADGGEGSLDIIGSVLKLNYKPLLVKGPRFKPVASGYMVSGDTAYIEMAKASGLELLSPHERNCLTTSSFGTGELIKDALLHGYRNIFLFIGGSATNDAGLGLANALGYTFLRSSGETIQPVGKELINVTTIDDKNLLPLAKEASFTVITDVKNELYGPNGAVFVYAKQKGAAESDYHILESGLRNIDKVFEKTFQLSVAKLPGAGAAGGLGAGLVALFGATIKPGIDTIMEITDFDNVIADANMIITGEGKLDLQSVEGKVVEGVCRKGVETKLPVGVVCGQAENRNQISKQLSIFSIRELKNEHITTQQAMQQASTLISKASKRMIVDFFHQEKP